MKRGKRNQDVLGEVLELLDLELIIPETDKSKLKKEKLNELDRNKKRNI